MALDFNTLVGVVWWFPIFRLFLRRISTAESLGSLFFAVLWTMFTRVDVG